MGYTDRMGLYEFVRGNPERFLDPSGLDLFEAQMRIAKMKADVLADELQRAGGEFARIAEVLVATGPGVTDMLLSVSDREKLVKAHEAMVAKYASSAEILRRIGQTLAAASKFADVIGVFSGAEVFQYFLTLDMNNECCARFGAGR